MSYHSRLSQKLEDLLAEAAEVAVIAAPFIKLPALVRVIDHLHPSVQLNVFTRWRVDEIVAGVSDLSIWGLISERPNSSGFLVDELHAKFFRSDSHCLVGSANITSTALGLTKRPNLELLIPMPFDDKLQEFESHLTGSSFEMTEAIHDEMASVVAAIPKGNEVDLQPLLQQASACWIPGLRDPRDLWRTYINDTSLIPDAIRKYSDFELSELGVPPGIETEAVFNRTIALALKQKTLVREIDIFLDQPRRFGEVKNLIRQSSGLANDEANFAWQTLMRWMLYFFPNSYQKIQPKHSEIFQRLPE